MVPQDAIRSTRVVTNTYDVARGQFSGGLVASTTRSGTNVPQGAFTYNGRDRALAWGGVTASPFSQGYTQNQIGGGMGGPVVRDRLDRKSTRLNSSHGYISYAVFCLKKKKPGGRARQREGRGDQDRPASGRCGGGRDLRAGSQEREESGSPVLRPDLPLRGDCGDQPLHDGRRGRDQGHRPGGQDHPGPRHRA